MKLESNRTKRLILQLLKNNGQTAFRPKEIAKRLGWNDTPSYRHFREALGELAREGLVGKVKGNRYTFRRLKSTSFDGILEVHPDGYGFVRIEGHEQDYYVARKRMSTALQGDLVRVHLLAAPRGNSPKRREAEVAEVIERRVTMTVGTLFRSGKLGYVRSDDARLVYDIYVGESDLGGAEAGDKVRVSIDHFDDANGCPTGRVLDRIGPADDPAVAVLALAMSRGVDPDFPDDVVKEASAVTSRIPDAVITKRVDLRSKRVFTIDPDDAKDFDDAIHISRLPNGNLEVGVHIADVSHYVRPGTKLDAEAAKRATSVYLVDRVIPMLPEVLSNDACSLRPLEDKLTYSCLLELSPQGRTIRSDFAETVIHSKCRFTYAQAQSILDGEEHDLADDVRLANEVALVLRNNRFKDGSIAFDRPEVKVILDEAGAVTDIERRVMQPANHLVEEFMLLANRTVALAVDGPADKNPFVYRTHDKPDLERIQALRTFVKGFGFDLALQKGNVASADLNRLLTQVRGTPKAFVIEDAALRSMAKAKYTVENIGHFGLGFSHYTHFTSPIRRYPDLIVHRLLKGYRSSKRLDIDIDELKAQCLHCSQKEKAAEEAERESIKLKQVEYMVQHVGEEFDGVVSGVTNFGVFVEMTAVLVEGMIPLREMYDDFYEYDERRYMLVGRDTRKTIQLGDQVRVVVSRADVEARKIDLAFAKKR